MKSTINDTFKLNIKEITSAYFVGIDDSSQIILDLSPSRIIFILDEDFSKEKISEFEVNLQQVLSKLEFNDYLINKNIGTKVFS